MFSVDGSRPKVTMVQPKNVPDPGLCSPPWGARHVVFQTGFGTAILPIGLGEHREAEIFGRPLVALRELTT